MEQLLKYTGGQILKAFDSTSGERSVSGYYTSNTVDLHGHIIDKNAMLAALEDYRQWGTIREMHENTIGKMVQIGSPEWNWLEASVSRTTRGNEVMQLVNEGIYKAFSVGLLVTDYDLLEFKDLKTEDLNGLPLNMMEMFRQNEYIFQIKGLTLIEVSIVDRPANPLARMQEVQNAVGMNLKPLPSILELGSKGDWESAIVGAGKIFKGVEVNQTRTAEQMETQMQNENDTEVLDTVEVETVEVTETEVEVVETVEPEVELAVETEEVSDTPETDAALMTKAIDHIAQLVEVVKSLAEKSIDTDALADSIAVAVTKRLSEQTPVAPVEEVEASPVVEETDTAADAPVEKSTPEMDMKTLAAEVAKLVREQLATEQSVRKGVVNNEPAVETKTDTKPVIKTLNRDDLRQMIVQVAARGRS